MVVVIGLLGPIAGGKSVVMAEWARLGAVTVRADDISRQLLAPGSDLLAAVSGQFGEQFLRPDGSLDRRALANLVFRDPVALGRLEAIVHPAMVRHMAELVAQERERERPAPAFVIEAANLVPMGALKLVDTTVLVTAPREVRIQRLMARDGVTRDYAEALVGVQENMGLEQFRADYTIDAGGDERATREAAQRLWSELVKAGE
ncbi:MAG: dephospho-CoA kinase [Armatimonadota bacterium]